MHLLKTFCDILLSERKLKRRLQKCNLRKSSKTDDSALGTIIRSKLETPSQCLQYGGIVNYYENHRVSKCLGTELCKFSEKKAQKEQPSLAYLQKQIATLWSLQQCIPGL